MNFATFSGIFCLTIAAFNIAFTDGMGLCKLAKMFPDASTKSCGGGGSEKLHRVTSATSQRPTTQKEDESGRKDGTTWKVTDAKVTEQSTVTPGVMPTTSQQPATQKKADSGRKKGTARVTEQSTIIPGVTSATSQRPTTQKEDESGRKDGTTWKVTDAKVTEQSTVIPGVTPTTNQQPTTQKKADHIGQKEETACEEIAVKVTGQSTNISDDATAQYNTSQQISDCYCVLSNGTSVSGGDGAVNQCYCLNSSGVRCLWLPQDCHELFEGGIHQNGVYTIQTTSSPKLRFDVYCNLTMTGGGWTVFQRRVDDYVDFNRSWTEYQEGFGDLMGSFWLGNEKLFHLTNQQRYQLGIELRWGLYLVYDDFITGSASANYSIVKFGSIIADSNGIGNGMAPLVGKELTLVIDETIVSVDGGAAKTVPIF